MGSEFEDELISLDARLEKAQKAAEGLVSGLKRVRRAARAGNVSEIVEGLGRARRSARGRSIRGARSSGRLAFRRVGLSG